MYGAPYIFYFVLPIVKRVKIMVQRVDFEQIRQLLCPATVIGEFYLRSLLKMELQKHALHFVCLDSQWNFECLDMTNFSIVRP